MKQANETLKNNPRYKRERISIIDREAFVEFYLLEDIVKLYNIRLKEEQAYVPQGRADEKGKRANIENFPPLSAYSMRQSARHGRLSIPAIIKRCGKRYTKVR